MSPILLRPIREQFEHNRMIRLLQTRLRRRYLVGVNIEDEREASGVRSGAALVYPDLVLTRTTGVRRLHGIVEVETAESVNHLEAMAEWVHFGNVRGAFYLYVPAGTTDIAQSLCERYGIAVTEIWSYHAVGDQMRFTMTHRSTRAASRAAAAARRVTKAGKKTARGAKRGARTAKRAVTSTRQSAKRATRSPTTAKRTSKTATRSPKTVRRATTTAKRTAKTVGRTAKTAKRKTGARSGRSAATRAVAKATTTRSRTTKKTVKGAKRRAASGGKISSRASTSASRSASKARRRSTAAGTQKTAASRRLRKQR